MIGCGGSGSNTITRMMEEGIHGAKLIAINTDAQHLVEDHRRSTHPHRAAADPGPWSRLDSPDRRRSSSRKRAGDSSMSSPVADMVFITVGLGGGTGTGCAPIVAKAAREEGALTIAIVTLPFTAEGAIRMENAEAGLERLRDVADTVIVVPNDRLARSRPETPALCGIQGRRRSPHAGRQGDHRTDHHARPRQP